MTQGFSSSVSPPITYADSPNLTASGRLRVADETTLFGAQLTYDLRPLQYEQSSTGTGATVTYDSTNRQALMTFASTPTGGESYMQSYSYFPYLPGRSQLIFVTFNLLSAATNVVKFAGYSDGVNGMEFQLSGSTKQFVLYSGTGSGTETITQPNWNLDTFDGSGPSGITLDISKVQILVIDFISLYAGRVRMGFDVGGSIYYCHEFLHANVTAFPYIQYATLPVRCGMTCTATVSTTMNFICASVSTEGGADTAEGFFNSFSTQNVAITAASGARTHVLSLRPSLTFNSITNRYKLEINTVNVNVDGANPVFWELVIGQALAGASYAAVNAKYSATDIDVAGTLSGSPTLVIASGYVASSNQSKSSVSADAKIFFPLTLDQAGAVRANGTVSLLATGIAGASAMNASINFAEVK